MAFRNLAQVLAAAAAVGSVALSGQALAGTATTRFTVVSPGANQPGGVVDQNVLINNELLSVGQGYPLLSEFTPDSNIYHSTSGTGSGLGFFSDSWASPFGFAAITLNEGHDTTQGYLYSNLTDQFAIDNLVDDVAIRNATVSTGSWRIETSALTAYNTLYLKFHGVLASAPGADRWVLASGKGRFSNNGTRLGSVDYPFEWLLGFDGGAPGTRPDFFTFTLPSDWGVSLNNFVFGYDDFSLDFAAGKTFSAPDNQTDMTLESAITCAVYNATCAATTIEIHDPVPPVNSVPAPLPSVGSLVAWRSRRQQRARRQS